jgi:ABC-2 type transport system ATP-binding protein
MIRTRDLSMHYGQLCALQGLTLEIAQGEFFAFLGPNAAGKTTTIKLLTGLLKPTSGDAWLCGHHIHHEARAAKSALGFVPDVAIFYDKLTSLEFMEFIADIYEVERGRARRLTGELFERFALRPYAGEQIEHLSHGTRQRLAIAAALLHEPKVIIIDEPMIGLDPVHMRVVKEELKARSRAGVTVFMSTHLLNIAEELADRIGIIHGGKLAALGTMEQLRSAARGGKTELEHIFLDLMNEAAASAEGEIRH